MDFEVEKHVSVVYAADKWWSKVLSSLVEKVLTTHAASHAACGHAVIVFDV